MVSKILNLVFITLIVLGAAAADAPPPPTPEDTPSADESQASAASVAPEWEHYHQKTTVDPAFILANNTLDSLLSKLAAPGASNNTRGIVLYNTFKLVSADDAENINMLRNFCYWLDRAGLLKHTMLITEDELSWHTIHQVGLPVYFDRVFPPRDTMTDPKEVEISVNRVFDVAKHWWGSHLIEVGYTAIYMDSDNIIFSPRLLEYANDEWDVQGLSDWGHLDLPVPGDIEQYPRLCNLYHWIEEPKSSVGHEMRAIWEIPEGVPRMAAPNPCQSTGLWIVKPTEPAKAFMRAMSHRIAVSNPWQWDQTAWNEVIIPFLWGSGPYPLLRYRLLPTEDFMQVHMWRMQKERTQQTPDPIDLHPAGIHGVDKRKVYEELGFWRPDYGKTFIFSEQASRIITSVTTAPRHLSAQIPVWVALLSMMLVAVATKKGLLQQNISTMTAVVRSKFRKANKPIYTLDV